MLRLALLLVGIVVLVAAAMPEGQGTTTVHRTTVNLQGFSVGIQTPSVGPASQPVMMLDGRPKTFSVETRAMSEGVAESKVVGEDGCGHGY